MENSDEQAIAGRKDHGLEVLLKTPRKGAQRRLRPF
jgi:hypothetical protein